MSGITISETVRYISQASLVGLFALGVAACSGAESGAQSVAQNGGEASTTPPLTDAAPDLAGEWTLSIDTPRGVQHPVLAIERTDNGYTATYSGRQGLLTIDEVTRDGNRFSFPLAITVPIGTIEVSYEGVIDGDRMTGVVANPRGEVPFSGERNK